MNQEQPWVNRIRTRFSGILYFSDDAFAEL